MIKKLLIITLYFFDIYFNKQHVTTWKCPIPSFIRYATELLHQWWIKSAKLIYTQRLFTSKNSLNCLVKQKACIASILVTVIASDEQNKKKRDIYDQIRWDRSTARVFSFIIYHIFICYTVIKLIYRSWMCASCEFHTKHDIRKVFG